MVILVLSFEAPDLVDERVVLPVGVLGSAATALSLPDLPEPLAFLPWEEACFLLGRSSLPLGVELRFWGLVRLLEPPLDLVEEAVLPVEDVFRDTAHDIRVQARDVISIVDLTRPRKSNLESNVTSVEQARPCRRW